jgi:hypothetical protein
MGMPFSYCALISLHIYVLDDRDIVLTHGITGTVGKKMRLGYFFNVPEKTLVCLCLATAGDDNVPSSAILLLIMQ